MPAASMRLKILMPSGVFAEVTGVTRVVAETRRGSFGILPHRLDCVAALRPGILAYAAEGRSGDAYVAVDEGVLVKAGDELLVSVRHAIGGADLGQLRAAVEREFLGLDEQEKVLRTAVAELEVGLMRHFAELHHV